MARNASDREDLLRDGVQMPIRGQAVVDGLEIFVGFRSAGQAAVYCNQDPVFQFNCNHELRRVFFDGHRYAAYSGRLYILKQGDATSQQASTSRLKLEPVLVSAEDSIALFDKFYRVRDLLLSRVAQWEFVGTGSMAEFAARVDDCLKQIGDRLTIAESPNA